MKTGIRFTCLKNGDNLLGQTWEYKGFLGVEAVIEKTKDLFLHADMLGVDYIIDTIQLGKDPSNNVFLPNTGVNGDIWKMADRLALYKAMCGKYNKTLFIELEFPTAVTDYNWQQYARFATEIIDKYSFIKRWQIMTTPEQIDETNTMKCSPQHYVQIMKYIYERIKDKYSDVKLGGPGIFKAVNEYVDSAYLNADKQTYHTGWLAEAIGELYGTDPKYDLTEETGFLPYISFFAFQGDSSSGVFNYNTFPLVIAKLRQGIMAQAQRKSLNLAIEFMSTKQGHYADKDNSQDLQLQAYRDLKEYMSDFIVDVVPFKTQLVDEFYNPLDLNSVKNVYGLLYYYLGNDRKPAYQQFNFLLNKLKDYSEVCRDEMLIKAKRPYDFTSDVQSVMFLNDKKDKVITVIYPSTERIVTAGNTIFTKVTIKSAINRTLLIPNGSKVTIEHPTDVNFKNYDFIIVEENLITTTKTKEDLLKEVDLKLTFYEMYVKNIFNMIPDDYNKEVYDTNFFKLIRAVGIEFGDMRHEMKVLDDNAYISTAHGDAIYNNFGAIIGVKWKPKWSEKQYRKAVSGIIESLLHGANKNSMQKAINAYTGFDVKIYEMFTDYKHYGLSQEVNWDNQYRFTVEISKDLDDKQELKDVYKDVKEVLDITKPAHTLPIIMIVLVGKEDYRKWYKERYGRDFSESDDFQMEVMDFEESNKFGWKSIGYDWALQSDKKTNYTVKTNSAFPIAPRYTLFDRSFLDYTQNLEEEVPKPKDELLLHMKQFFEDRWNKELKDEYDMTISYSFNERRYGIKPYLQDRVLKTTSGLVYNKYNEIIGSERRKTNSYKTGFTYHVYDDMLLLFEYTNSEVYHKVEELKLEMELQFLFKDSYDKLKLSEDMILHMEQSLYELKFGIVPNHLNTLITYTEYPIRRQQRTTNKYRSGIKYRLLDEMTLCETVTSFSDSYEKPKDKFGIKMYKVDAHGNEIIIREEGF